MANRLELVEPLPNNTSLPESFTKSRPLIIIKRDNRPNKETTMPSYRPLADVFVPESMEYIRGERPPPWRKCHILLAALLILPVTLLLIVSLWLFVSFENQANSPELKLIPQTELLNETRPQPNYLDGLIGSLYTPLALNPAEPWPQIRSSQILVKVPDVTKLVTTNLTTRLFHDTLPNRPLQKSLIVWYVHYHRYLADEEEIEA